MTNLNKTPLDVLADHLKSLQSIPSDSITPDLQKLKDHQIGQFTSAIAILYSHAINQPEK